MFSLRAELETALDVPEEGLSTERLILKQRLSSHGKALLTAVRENSRYNNAQRKSLTV